MADASTTGRAVTAGDILIRLESSQRGFRAVMLILGVLLVLVAVIVAGSTAFSISQLSNLEARTSALDSTTAVIEAKADSARAAQVAALAETLRTLETTQTSWREFANDYNSARRNIDVVARLDTLAPDALVDFAVELASRHLTGVPLDLSTQEALARALDGRNADGGLLVDGDERTLLLAARADWMRSDDGGEDARDDEARRLFAELARDGGNDVMRGLGEVGLAERRFADAVDTLWEGGCADAVEHADAALDLGVRGPNVHYILGQCLRKHGETVEAYQAFVTQQALVDANPELYDHSWMPYSYQAAHGMGTTLMALAAELPPGGRLAIGAGEGGPAATYEREEALDIALDLLNQAAAGRRAYGATEVGANYTRENIGIIYLQKGDWDGALAHTAQVNAVIALPWNLTFRYIAAKEKLAALGANPDPIRAAELEDVAHESWLVLGEMRPSRFAPAELEKLLPSSLHGYVREVVAHAREGEATRLAAN
jgi:tetratricopeptide (TPR) repeat protein